MNGEIKHLYVTLKRSFAGTRESHVNILRSLGLRKREQTLQKANSATIRGAIDKVHVYIRRDFTVTQSDAYMRPYCTGQALGPCRN